MTKRHQVPNPIDTTFKTGCGSGLLFAPKKEMVYGHKHGKGDTRFSFADPLTDDEYRLRYYQMMRNKYKSLESAILSDIVPLGEVTVLCYCKPSAFCHRHFVVDIIDKVCAKNGIDVHLRGEWV